MKILVVGSGAREHALVRAIARGGAGRDLLAAPGNGGISLEARCLPIGVDKTEALVEAALANSVDLVIVGPEAPLVAGLADRLRDRGIATFGPGASAARLEGSKAFSKEFMRRHGIPTAEFGVFDSADDAEDYIRALEHAPVVKADGLAAGKGVVVAHDTDEALDTVDYMMRRRAFGDAGARLVVEDRLDGQELSLHVVTDGSRYLVLGAAQDHKRIGDGDTGPNTGGMGAYAPVPVVTDALHATMIRTIVEPTLAGLRSEGLAFRGVLFVGVMITRDGPSVLEYNVRFGDPECSVLLARLDGDVLPLLDGAARGDLSSAKVKVAPVAALTVVMAAKGYPAGVRTGDEIRGLEAASAIEGVQVFHAGTRHDGGRIITSGGRVLAVTARAAELRAARELAYRAVAEITFDGEQHRTDIAHRALA